MVDDILQNLRKDGRLEKEGEFRLDPEKAREKLRHFRLPDPHRWVLEIVSAANILQATKVEFRVDADEVEAHFNGIAFEAEDLSDLFNAAFREAKSLRDLAAKQLAIGFTAAEALNPSSFILESGTSRLTLAPGEPRVEVIALREDTRIYFRQAFRARHVIEFFKNLRGNVAEKTYLKEFAKYSDAVVVLDQTRISFPFNFGGQPAHGIVEADGTRGHIRILPAERTSRTHLTQFGVLILTQTQKDYPGSEAVLDCPSLQRDLSNASFVKDDAFKSAMELSRALYYEGVYNLYHNLKRHEFLDAPLEPLAIHVIETIAEKRHRGEEESQVLARLGALFEGLVLWPMADRPAEPDAVIGQSAKTPLARVRQAQKLYVSTQSHHREAIEGKSPVILVTKRHILDLTVAELQTYLGFEVEDVTQELQHASLISQNRAAWSNRPWPISLTAIQCIRTVQSKHGAFSVSVGVAHENAPHPTGVWVKHTRLLCQSPSPFDVIISGPVEDYEYAGPSLTDANKALAFEAVHEIHRLFLSISSLTSVEPAPQIRRAGRIYFAALASQKLHEDILNSLGFGEAISEFWDKFSVSDSPLALGDFEARGVSLDSLIRSLGDFADLRIFERVDAKGSHSFAELVRASKESRLLVVKEADRGQLFSHFSSVPSDGVFIWTDPAMDRALYSVFGGDVKPGLDEIMAFSQASAFLQRNARPFVVEQPARYTVMDTFEALGCEVIMAWRNPGPGTRNQFRVRYFYEDRVLEEEALKPIPGEFLVYARGSAIEPNTEYSAVDRSKKRTKLQLELVRRAYELVVAWLAQQFEIQLTKRDPATTEVLDLLVLSQPRKLRDLKFLSTTTGARVSPAQVRNWKGPLAFSESAEVVADFIPAEAPGVLRATRTALESLFPKTTLVDCSANDELVATIRRNRDRFFAKSFISIRPPATRIADVTLSTEGLDVHLWMLPDSEPGNRFSYLSLDIIFEDRILCAHTIQVPLGRFEGIIRGSAVSPDVKTYDRLAKTPDDLDAKLLQIGETCFLDWLSKAEDESQLWYLSRCDENTKTIWPSAYEALRQRSLFRLCDGTSVSCADLVEGKSLILWSGVADELNGLPASQVVLARGALAQPTKLLPGLPWRHVNGVEVDHPMRSSTGSVSEPTAVGRHEGQVLKDWLLGVDGLHSHAFLSQIADMRPLGGGRLFVYVGDNLVMDLEHPIGLGLVTGDPDMLPLAASSLYSFLGSTDSLFDFDTELSLHRALVSRLIQDV